MARKDPKPVLNYDINANKGQIGFNSAFKGLNL